MANDTPFGNVVFSYTDEMAMQDGALIPITHLGLVKEGRQVNRITAALYHRVNKAIADTDGLGEVTDQMLTVIYAALVVGVKDKEGDGYLYSGVAFDGQDVCLMLNEVDGFTLMFASDY